MSLRVKGENKNHFVVEQALVLTITHEASMQKEQQPLQQGY